MSKESLIMSKNNHLEKYNNWKATIEKVAFEYRIKKFNQIRNYKSSDENFKNYFKETEKYRKFSYPAESVKTLLENYLDENKNLFGISWSSVESIHDVKTDRKVLILEMFGDMSFLLTFSTNLSNKLMEVGWNLTVEHEKYNFDVSANPKSMYYVILDSEWMEADDEHPLKIPSDKIKFLCSDKFFHVSFSKFENKILKNGLIPMETKRSRFLSPKRTYFFKNYGIADRFMRQHVNLDLFGNNLEYVQHMVKMNTIKKMDKKTNTIVDVPLKFQDEKIGMVLFSVDLKKIVNDGKTIYLDSDTKFTDSDYSYFTCENISPEYIQKIDKILIPFDMAKSIENLKQN